MLDTREPAGSYISWGWVGKRWKALKLIEMKYRDGSFAPKAAYVLFLILFITFSVCVPCVIMYPYGNVE